MVGGGRKETTTDRLRLRSFRQQSDINEAKVQLPVSLPKSRLGGCLSMESSPGPYVGEMASNLPILVVIYSPFSGAVFLDFLVCLIM